VYFVDDVNELRPLIFENNGQPFLPMFGQKDLESFRIARAQEETDRIEEMLDRQEKGMSERPGMRSLGEAYDRTLLGNQTFDR
jgi:hypothetical protein